MSHLNPINPQLSSPSKISFAQLQQYMGRLWEQLHGYFAKLMPRPKYWIHLGWFGGLQIHQRGGRT